ncbi:hypothetical protein N7457_001721 [Penicillium paradoxum]|uniref:uncharacterized protein n=1 Tax=Penicillium paradoxum TaxID=176176 RepID=UPI002549662B|nr:uncharacterized protein N7457_001721 [Penicillium paradoxum]KAJ5795122.1 hypothetical protein N7457_001721 [Penicillium paradoxum]
MLSTLVYISLAVFAVPQVSAFQVWRNSDLDKLATPLSVDCQNALTYNIECVSELMSGRDIMDREFPTGDSAKAYCAKACYDSLLTFQKGIDSHCGNIQIPSKNNNETLFPVMIAREFKWIYELTCIQDSSGLCMEDLMNGELDECSDCVLQYMVVMASPDSHWPISPEDLSLYLLMCGVPMPTYPYSNALVLTPIVTSSTPSGLVTPTATSTCQGHIYISKEGDDCKSISKAHSMSTDRLIEVNFLDYMCSPIEPGTELCIQDICDTHTIEPSETCQGIVRDRPFGLVQLMGWNPTIHQNCDNLDYMAGRSICISPPGEGEFNLPKSRTSTTRGLTTSLIDSWVPAETIAMSDFLKEWYPTPGNPGEQRVLQDQAR